MLLKRLTTTQQEEEAQRYEAEQAYLRARREQEEAAAAKAAAESDDRRRAALLRQQQNTQRVIAAKTFAEQTVRAVRAAAQTQLDSAVEVQDVEAAVAAAVRLVALERVQKAAALYMQNPIPRTPH